MLPPTQIPTLPLEDHRGMEGVTSSRNAFDDGNQIPVAALDFLDNLLIPVNERADPVTDPELNPLATRNKLEQIRQPAKRHTFSSMFQIFLGLMSYCSIESPRRSK